MLFRSAGMKITAVIITLLALSTLSYANLCAPANSTALQPDEWTNGTVSQGTDNQFATCFQANLTNPDGDGNYNLTTTTLVFAIAAQDGGSPNPSICINLQNGNSTVSSICENTNTTDGNADSVCAGPPMTFNFQYGAFIEVVCNGSTCPSATDLSFQVYFNAYDGTTEDNQNRCGADTDVSGSSDVWIWILVAVGVIVLLVIVIVAVGGVMYYLKKKKEANNFQLLDD